MVAPHNATSLLTPALLQTECVEHNVIIYVGFSTASRLKQAVKVARLTRTIIATPVTKRQKVDTGQGLSSAVMRWGNVMTHVLPDPVRSRTKSESQQPLSSLMNKQDVPIFSC